MYVGKYEVTQLEFESLMGFNPSEFIKPNNPVENVKWYDLVAYCNEKSDVEGLIPYYNISDIVNYGDSISSATVTENNNTGYRLLTSNEWKYCARGGKNGNVTSYAGSNTIEDVAWYWYNNETNGEIGGTKEVGRKKANELGIYDMTGNVWEWTSSLSDSKHILFGGAWCYIADSCVIDSNDSSDNCTDNFGSRCTRTK